MRHVFDQLDLAPVPVRDKAYEALKRAIIEGRLAPGRRLIEVQVSAALRISRTPLREAILKLEGDGFLRRLTSGGLQVKPLSVQEIRELYAVRSVLEGLAAREAAERLTAEQLDRLASLIPHIENADGQRPDIRRIAELGAEFHAIILEASGNRKCGEHLRLLRDHIDRYRYLTIATPGRGRAAAREHRALLAVLRRRDPADSEQAMRRHVLEAGEAMMRRLDEVRASAENDMMAEPG